MLAWHRTSKPTDQKSLCWDRYINTVQILGCNRVTAAQEIECPHYSRGLKLSEGKPSYKPLLSRLWAPWWAVPGSTALLFWQSHTDDDSTSSFLPPLRTGPQAGKQALLLFLVVLLSGCCFCLIFCSFEGDTQGLTAQTCWQGMH